MRGASQTSDSRREPLTPTLSPQERGEGEESAGDEGGHPDARTRGESPSPRPSPRKKRGEGARAPCFGAAIALTLLRSSMRSEHRADRARAEEADMTFHATRRR